MATTSPQLSRRSSCLSLDSSQPRCRLCWGEDSGEGNGQLISPCSCKGSMQYIHFGCLQRWLEVTRQQGRSRRSIRCEVCKAKYNSDLHSSLDGEDQTLMPSIWHDPFTIASIIHGTYRAVVAINGLWHAYAMYRNMQYGTSSVPLVPASSTSNTTPSSSATGGGTTRTPYYSTGRLNSSSVSLPWPAQQQREQHQILPDLQGQHAVGHHFSVSLPLGGGRVYATANQDVLTAIRERFDGATMVQVYWYSSLMALMPAPPNGDAFAGMALGATIGGILAQLFFLPMLGSGKIAALSHSCRLLVRCLVRLAAAEACQAKGYRLLASAVRVVMQPNGLRLPWLRGLLRQLRRQQQVEPVQQGQQ